MSSEESNFISSEESNSDLFVGAWSLDLSVLQHIPSLDEVLMLLSKLIL